MKVVCTLPNASSLINGVKFEVHKLGMISEEIEDDVAAVFLKIKGYVAAPAPKAATAPAAPAAVAPTASAPAAATAAPAAAAS
jgi:hypothetical protein